jgi:mono/diheme cytochrome c family protein
MLLARLSLAIQFQNFGRFVPLLVATILFFVGLDTFSVREAKASEELSELQRKALAILQTRCIECHQEKVREGGLRLDLREGLMQGGDSGSAIQPGNSTESLLIQRVTAGDDSRMPPHGSPLDASAIDALREFIDAGAPWENQTLSDPRRSHWAWKPLQESSLPPAVEVDGEEDNPIDRFLASSLATRGLKPLGISSRETLIRRLSFDLLGLPPSPDEVDQFVADRSPDAWERLVDRMLASPRYGERWARHWLDIAHYADTHGFERDQRRDHAWRYRDWVIDTWNADLPFDTLIEHQIAGDVLPGKTPESTIASSFLAVGPWDFVGQVETPSPLIKRLARADDLDDMVAQVMTSFCGITIHCARCHHHKLDPIAQEEYYGLTAIFSGVKRGDRIVSDDETKELEAKRTKWTQLQRQLDEEIQRATGGISLADLVGGGNGWGSGAQGSGIDPSNGEIRDAGDRRGFLGNVVANRLNPTRSDWIDSVFVPDGGAMQLLAVSRSGTMAHGIPATDRKAWDAIRNGPVNSQFSTSLAGVECAPPGRSMISLHANAGITFRLHRDRLLQSLAMVPSPRDGLLKDLKPQPSATDADSTQEFVFQAMVGYFGQTPRNGADVFVLLDGQVVYQHRGLGRDDGLQSILLPLPPSDCILTWIATDGGNGISHDQVCFVDAAIVPKDREHSKEESERMESLRKQSEALRNQLASLPEPRRVYGVIAENPTEVRLLHRGNTEEPREPVFPGVVQCLGPVEGSIEQLDNLSTDSQRRIALAEWLTSRGNPLPARVIVNRLWHHHFGRGIVSTPSDFGLGGSLPSHPELLDWLALQLQDGGWSLKRIQRMLLLSSAYQRISFSPKDSSNSVDADNRFLWRQNPRRLDAESLRDAMLSTSDSLDRSMHGPGYRDFDYQEEYAPVYQHRVMETPEVFRRSIYRFVVRTTPHPFLTTLDCPNPATMTPVRNTTTTAVQSLATLNNAFVLQQSDRFAQRIARESGQSLSLQAELAIRLAFGRRATGEEVAQATQLIQEAGLFQLSRILFNTNEFVYVD